MSSAIITKRVRKTRKSYVVRYQLGGRAYPLVHGGSFHTEPEAKVRRDLIAGELAAGRNPADLLATLKAKPVPTATLSTWADRYLASRLDVDTNTTKNYRTALRKIGKTFGDRDPAGITGDDVAGWVAELAKTHRPGTIQLYLLTFRMLLDYCQVAPNPARDPRVKLPKRVTEEPTPPPADHFLAILGEIKSPLRRLLFITLEQGALRLGEAVQLRWGDVDRAGLRLRLPKSAKRDKARWVYLPEWLLDALEETCPPDDRTPDRRVFQGITEATAYQAMLRACQSAACPRSRPRASRGCTRPTTAPAGHRRVRSVSSGMAGALRGWRPAVAADPTALEWQALPAIPRRIIIVARCCVGRRAPSSPSSPTMTPRAGVVPVWYRVPKNEAKPLQIAGSEDLPV